MYEDVVKTRLNLEQAKANSSFSSTDFNLTNKSVNKDRIEAAERVGWFAGASISLSFTLIGYLFSKEIFLNLLHDNFLLLSFLIIGWVCLSVAILGSLLVRLLNANYLNYNSWGDWLEKKIKEFEAEFAYMDSGGIYIDVGDIDAYRSRLSDLKQNHGELEGKAKNKANFTLKLVNLSMAAVFTGCILGLLSLVVFLIYLTSLFLF